MPYALIAALCGRIAMKDYISRYDAMLKDANKRRKR